MKAKTALPLMTILPCVALGTISCGENLNAEKPNIVFIMVDDLGWADVNYNGSTFYETPNLNRMSKNGMTFTDFYSAGPVSSPTRASILTGKYPVRTGITTYLLSPQRDAKHVTNELSTEELTFAEVLKDNSYRTGYFGKWHLGYSKEHWAGNQGFEVAVGGMDLSHAWEIAHPDVQMPDIDRNKGHQRFFSPHHLTFMENGPEGEYLTDRLTNETINFIKENKDEPFFAFLSFHTVHTPLEAKEEQIAKYVEKAKKMGLDTIRNKDVQRNPKYAAMVEHMDENVGRVMQCLEDLDIAENTILIFTSDNGGKGGVTSNLPLKGMKHNLDEGGIRVHTVVQWKGNIKNGSVCSHPMVSTDFYPTFLDLAGVSLIPEQHLDGLSMKDILLGEKTEVKRNAIYWHYPHSRMEGAVRKGDYKLLYNYKTKKVTLYNLKEDIGEKTDLSVKEKVMVEEMLELLKSWLISVNAKYPKGVSA